MCDRHKRALKILQKEGPNELCKSLIRSIFWQLDPHHLRRFKFHTWKNHLVNRIRYDAPPDPYKKIWIKPKNIKYRLKQDNEGSYLYRKPTLGGLGQIQAGNWDSKDYAESIEELTLVDAFEKKYIEGEDWENTRHYEKLLCEQKNNKKYKNHGFESPEQYLDKYFNKYHELYKKISDKGYKINDKSRSLAPSTRSTVNVYDRLEVLVCIDREGDIHLFDGHHRFSIARVLDLEIPVQVICRHKQWQKTRDKIYNKEYSNNQEELRDNPDVHDILN